MNSHLTVKSIGTEKYQFSHMHLPQNNVSGFWFFEVKFSDHSTIETPYVGIFTEAKRQLMADVRGRWSDKNIISLEVLP
jgi:hypothetical protein